MTLELEARVLPEGDLRADIEALAGSFAPAWHTTLNREPELPAWFLAREDGRLIGFLTVFAPTADAVEISALVDPERRRRGVFTRLLAEAQKIWSAPERRWLLVAERSGAGAVAQRLGTLAFTEATLALPAGERPPFPGLPGGLTLVGAEPADVAALESVLDRANGDEPGDHGAFLNQVISDPTRRLVVLKLGDRPVGVGGLHRDGGTTGLFALAIDPDHQGKGWGRFLVLGLLDLGAPGTREFVIDVDSTNARAEKLYRSVGFADRQVTDYYEMPQEAP